MAAVTQLTQRQLLNVVQACAMVGICRRTLYNWMRLGLIEYVCVPSGHRRIYADSLLRDPEERPS